MEVLSNFLSKARVLIVDGCLASRLAMRESMLELGAQAQNLMVAKNLSEARALMKTGSIQLLISDYLLSDGLGIDLMEQSKRDFIFLLVSGDSSQAAVAKAAEEDVDDFMFKPYAFEDFKAVLEGVITRRLHPDRYAEWMEEGKRLLSEGIFEAAITQFEKTKSARTTFASACAHLAQIRRFRNEILKAKAEYQNGLGVDDIHFRCLNGLYEILIHQKSISEAYIALKNLVLSFPEHPERLSVAVSLAIQTRNFHDVDVFYEIFTQIYQKTPSLINHLSSALSVTGRYHLMKKRPQAAMECFKNAIEVSEGKPKFIDYITRHLSQAGYGSEAEALLDRHTQKAG